MTTKYWNLWWLLISGSLGSYIKILWIWTKNAWLWIKLWNEIATSGFERIIPQLVTELVTNLACITENVFILHLIKIKTKDKNKRQKTKDKRLHLNSSFDRNIGFQSVWISSAWKNDSEVQLFLYLAHLTNIIKRAKFQDFTNIIIYVKNWQHLWPNGHLIVLSKKSDALF